MSASAVSGEMSAKVDTGEIRRAVALICAPGQVHELRALGTKKGTISGYFTDLDRLARAASWCSLPAFGAEGVCITLNPVRADLLARAANETKPFAKHTTADSEILYYRWLPIDFDPQRPSGISSSAPEHEAARAKAAEVRTYLATLGWQPAIFADSGNGHKQLQFVDFSLSYKRK